jgi:hypothetical protein
MSASGLVGATGGIAGVAAGGPKIEPGVWLGSGTTVDCGGNTTSTLGAG